MLLLIQLHNAHVLLAHKLPIAAQDLIADPDLLPPSPNFEVKVSDLSSKPLLAIQQAGSLQYDLARLSLHAFTKFVLPNSHLLLNHIERILA
ncbi:hypothetical protein SMG44B_20223 [Stenotrophomonas maltophilia]|nr:hypothetical protein BN126310263 [Stenotrophomonas maltophilia]